MSTYAIPDENTPMWATDEEALDYVRQSGAVPLSDLESPSGVMPAMEGLSTIARAAIRVPANVVAGVAGAIQGAGGTSIADPGILGEYRKNVGTWNEELIKDTEKNRNLSVLPGITAGDIAESPANLGFSLGTAAVALPAGAAGELLGPVAGIAAASAAAFAAGKRGDEAMLVEQLLTLENEKRSGRKLKPMTREEEKSFVSRAMSKIDEHGLWESGSEAVQQGAEWSIFKKVLKGTLGRTFAGKVAKAAIGFMGIETGGEAVTQIGQSKVEHELGLRKEEPLDWTPEGMTQAVKEVLPQTAIISAVVPGAAFGGRALSNKFRQRREEKSDKATIENWKEEIDAAKKLEEEATAKRVSETGKNKLYVPPAVKEAFDIFATSNLTNKDEFKQNRTNLEMALFDAQESGKIDQSARDTIVDMADQMYAQANNLAFNTADFQSQPMVVAGERGALPTENANAAMFAQPVNPEAQVTIIPGTRGEMAVPAKSPEEEMYESRIELRKMAEAAATEAQKTEAAQKAVPAAFTPTSTFKPMPVEYEPTQFDELKTGKDGKIMVKRTEWTPGSSWREAPTDGRVVKSNLQVRINPKTRAREYFDPQVAKQEEVAARKAEQDRLREIARLMREKKATEKKQATKRNKLEKLSAKLKKQEGRVAKAATGPVKKVAPTVIATPKAKPTVATKPLSDNEIENLIAETPATGGKKAAGSKRAKAPAKSKTVSENLKTLARGAKPKGKQKAATPASEAATQAGESLKKAAGNVVESLKKLGKGAAVATGSVKPGGGFGTLNLQTKFDKAKWIEAKQIFDEAWESIDEAERNLRDFIKHILTLIEESWKPYLVKWAKAKNTEHLAEVEKNPVFAEFLDITEKNNANREPAGNISNTYTMPKLQRDIQENKLDTPDKIVQHIINKHKEGIDTRIVTRELAETRLIWEEDRVAFELTPREIALRKKHKGAIISFYKKGMPTLDAKSTDTYDDIRDAIVGRKYKAPDGKLSTITHDDYNTRFEAAKDIAEEWLQRDEERALESGETPESLDTVTKRVVVAKVPTSPGGIARQKDWYQILLNMAYKVMGREKAPDVPVPSYRLPQATLEALSAIVKKLGTQKLISEEMVWDKNKGEYAKRSEYQGDITPDTHLVRFHESAEVWARNIIKQYRDAKLRGKLDTLVVHPNTFYFPGFELEGTTQPEPITFTTPAEQHEFAQNVISKGWGKKSSMVAPFSRTRDEFHKIQNILNDRSLETGEVLSRKRSWKEKISMLIEINKGALKFHVFSLPPNMEKLVSQFNDGKLTAKQLKDELIADEHRFAESILIHNQIKEKNWNNYEVVRVSTKKADTSGIAVESTAKAEPNRKREHTRRLKEQVNTPMSQSSFISPEGRLELATSIAQSTNLPKGVSFTPGGIYILKRFEDMTVEEIIQEGNLKDYKPLMVRAEEYANNIVKFLNKTPDAIPAMAILLKKFYEYKETGGGRIKLSEAEDMANIGDDRSFAQSIINMQKNGFTSQQIFDAIFEEPKKGEEPSPANQFRDAAYFAFQRIFTDPTWKEITDAFMTKGGWKAVKEHKEPKTKKQAEAEASRPSPEEAEKQREVVVSSKKDLIRSIRTDKSFKEGILEAINGVYEGSPEDKSKALESNINKLNEQITELHHEYDKLDDKIEVAKADTSIDGDKRSQLLSLMNRQSTVFAELQDKRKFSDELLKKHDSLLESQPARKPKLVNVEIVRNITNRLTELISKIEDPRSLPKSGKELVWVMNKAALIAESSIQEKLRGSLAQTFLQEDEAAATAFVSEMGLGLEEHGRESKQSGSIHTPEGRQRAIEIKRRYSSMSDRMQVVNAQRIELLKRMDSMPEGRAKNNLRREVESRIEEIKYWEQALERDELTGALLGIDRSESHRQGITLEEWGEDEELAARELAGNKLLPEDIAENENKILRGLDILINGVEIARAPKTYSSFILDCKEILGNLWNHIKQYASKLWNRLNERRAFLKGTPVSSDTMHSTRDLSHAITVPGLAAIKDSDSVTAGQRIYATLTNHLAEASGKFSSDPVMQNYIEMFGKLWKGKLVNVNSTRDRWWQAFEYVAGPGAGVFANLTTRQSYALRDYLVREGVARRGNQWKDRSAIGTAAAEIGKRATKLRAKHYFRAAKNTIGPYDMVPKMIDHIFKNIKNDGVEVKLSDNWGMVKNGRNSRHFTRIADQKFFQAAQATGLIPFDLWERVSNPARFDIKDVRVIKQFNKRQRLVQVKLGPRNFLSFLHDTKDGSYKLMVGSEDINHHGNAEFFRRIDALERSQGREAVRDEAGKFTVTESWLKSQLPTAAITAESDNTFRVILPGGYGFRISANNEVLKGISESGEEVDLAGNWTLDKLSGGLISIAKLSKEGTATTLDHEVFHMATDIFLTKSEQALMTDMYGSWEQAAVAYENWIPASNLQMGTANPSFFSKLLQSIRDLLFHLKSWLFNYSPYMQRNRLFTEIRSGRAFNRIPSLNLHSYPNEKFRIEWLGNSTAIVVRDGKNAKLYDPTMGASNRILDTLPMESENKELLKRIFKPASHETILTDRPILKRIIDRLSKDDEKLQAELGIKGLEPGTAEYMYSLPFWLKMEKTDSKLALVLKLGKSGYIVETNDAGLKVSKYPFHAIASEIEDRRFGEKSQLDYDFYKKTKTFQTLKDSEIKPLYPIMLWSTIHGERYLTWQELKNPSFIRKVYEKMGETAPSYELSDYQARAYQEAAQQMDEMYDKQIAALELANLAPYQRNLTAKEFTVLKTLYKDLVNNKTPNLNLLERPNLIHKTTDASGKTRTTNPTKTAWNNLSKKLEDIRKLRSQISKSKGYFPLKHQAGAYYTVVIRRWKSSDPSTWEKGETVAYYGSKTLAQAKETEDFLRALPEYTDMEIKSNRSSNPHESTYWGVGDFNTARMVDLAVQKASFDKDITWEQARNLSDAAHYAIVDMLRIRGAAQSAVGRKVLQWKDQKYAKGYVTDKLRDVVNAYATGYNGMHTKMKAAIEYVELIGAIPANMPNTYDQISAYANNMLRNKDNIDQKIGFLKRRAFEFYLLGKVSMAYLQMVQNFVTAIPALTVDMKQAGFKNWTTAAERYYTKAMIDRAAWKYNEAFLPEDEQRFLHEGQRRGYMMARFVSDLKAQAAPVNMQILKAGFDALAWPIEGMEILNRESAALAYYRFMKADPTLSKLSFEEMQKRTAEYINRTHFQYGKGNLPSWAADSSMLSKFANLAYTFVPFTHNFTLSVVHMFRSNGGTEGVVYLGKSMFYLALFGGIPALPGVDEIVDLCEMLTKRPLRAELRAFINKRAGGLVERFALSGIPGLINIDVSAAVKPVQLPGFLRGEDINKSIFGVMGGIVQGAAKGVSTAYNHGDYLKAAELALPTALANVFKAYRLTFRGATYPSSGLPVEVGEDARQLKLDVYTPGGWIPYYPMIMQGFGFKNYDYSQNMEDLWTMRKMRMKFVEKEQALRVQYRLADSPEAKLKVSEKIRELNRGIPDALKGIIKPMSIPSTYNRTSTRAVRSYYRNLNED